MKAKNILTSVFILLLLGLSLFFMAHKIRQIQQKKDVYNAIPAFRLADISGNIITESLLKKNKSTLFLYFNPDCELCREEFVQIKLNQKAFQHFQLVFFSGLPADTIVRFLQEIAFVSTPNMLFLIDDKEELIDKMEVKTSPASYIYNKQGKLIKRFDGSVKVETLINYLSDNHLQ